MNEPVLRWLCAFKPVTCTGGGVTIRPASRLKEGLWLWSTPHACPHQARHRSLLGGFPLCGERLARRALCARCGARVRRRAPRARDLCSPRSGSRSDRSGQLTTAASMLGEERLIYSQIAADPQVLHDFFYVDNPVTFDRDNSWGSSSTGYAGDLPIAEFPKFDLISGSYEDRSPIHSPYDYE